LQEGIGTIQTWFSGFQEAFTLIIGGDSQLAEIVLLSLRVSGIALLISTVLGIPTGALLGLTRFRGRRLLVALVYTGMAFPPVVIGLFVYLLLSRSGVLGSLDISWMPKLFTPEAMILAQVIIAYPLVAGFTMAAVQAVDPALRMQVQSLGASRWQTTWAILEEASVGVIAAVVAGFGGIISEVGAVMLVGGNIAGQTRVLTTAIVLETNKGNFGLALALGVILLNIAFATNFIILRLEGRSFDE
jgi:tungstate transport system permease protein